MVTILHKSKLFKIPQEKINKYAQVSGGTAKIHTDPEYAKQTVFKGTLVHGMYLIALIENELSKLFKNWKGSLDIKFIKPIKEHQQFRIEFNNSSQEDIEVSLILDNDQIAVSGIAKIKSL